MLLLGHALLAANDQQPLCLIDVFELSDRNSILQVNLFLTQGGLNVLLKVLTISLLHLFYYRHAKVVHRQVSERSQDAHVFFADCILVHSVKNRVGVNHLNAFDYVATNLLVKHHRRVRNVINGVVGSSQGLLSHTYQRIRLRCRSVHNLIDTRGISNHLQVVIVKTNQLVDVSDAISNLSDRRILEAAFWVFTSVVEDTRLLVNIVQVQRLKFSSFPS